MKIKSIESNAAVCVILIIFMPPMFLSNKKIKMNSVLVYAMGKSNCFFLFFACFYGCSKSMKNLIAQNVLSLLCHCSSFAWYYSFLPLLFLMMIFCWCCCHRRRRCCHWLTIQPLLLLLFGWLLLLLLLFRVWCFHRQRLDFVWASVCSLRCCCCCCKWKKTISWVESNTQSDFDIDEFDVICHWNPKRIGITLAHTHIQKAAATTTTTSNISLEWKKAMVYAYTYNAIYPMHNTRTHRIFTQKLTLASHILDVTLTNKIFRRDESDNNSVRGSYARIICTLAHTTHTREKKKESKIRYNGNGNGKWNAEQQWHGQTRIIYLHWRIGTKRARGREKLSLEYIC